MTSSASMRSVGDPVEVPALARPAGGPLRVAIAGAGAMARHHASVIGRLGPVARLVAVADPDASARRALAAATPGLSEHDTLSALLEACAVDVIHVCTPPATHRALAAEAIEAGCHVYVEKPFTETEAETAEVLSLAEAAGIKVCAGHQLLYEAPARRADVLLPALGHLVHAESYFSFRAVRRSPDGRAPLRSDLQLLDILPHPVYLLLHYLELAGEGQTDLTGLELGRAGTVHGLVRRGTVTGHLVVTLESRPIESYMRLVGTNGALCADFVRGTVQRLLGPGTSGIDKLLAPYRVAGQLASGTTMALGRRFLDRQRSYPGLTGLVSAFYSAIRTGGPLPLSPASIRDTVRICEAVSSALRRPATGPRAPPARPGAGPSVLITGGTGFLGRAVAGALGERGARVHVLARREPALWERLPAVSYHTADLAAPLPDHLLEGMDVIVHTAAETAGGWNEHQRNSLDGTERLVRAAAASGVHRVIHISSLAVLASATSGPVSENTPLEPDSRGAGPYVWGKLESEKLARRLGEELGVAVKVVRPGAILDLAEFDPPGRLGRRVGPLFVAVGSRRDPLGIVDLGFSGEVLAWMAEHFDEAPSTLNLLAPELPTKQALVERLRRANPDLRVVWLPTALLVPLSWVASTLQRLLRPGTPVISLQRVFAVQRYDTSLVRAISRALAEVGSGGLPAVPGPQG